MWSGELSLLAREPQSPQFRGGVISRWFCEALTGLVHESRRVVEAVDAIEVVQIIEVIEIIEVIVIGRPSVPIAAMSSELGRLQGPMVSVSSDRSRVQTEARFPVAVDTAA